MVFHLVLNFSEDIMISCWSSFVDCTCHQFHFLNFKKVIVSQRCIFLGWGNSRNKLIHIHITNGRQSQVIQKWINECWERVSNHSQTLKCSNFVALLPTDPILPLWKDLSPLPMYIRSLRGWQYSKGKFCPLEMTLFPWSLFSNRT